MVDVELLNAAYRKVRDELLAARVPAGHWVGELSTSALSTATAISALAIVVQRSSGSGGVIVDESGARRFSDLTGGGLQWLVETQNSDGGWGDTDKSLSNIATTMLVQAAFHLAGAAMGHAGLLARADGFVKERGGIAGLRRRYGKDKTFAVPILTNCALAGLVDWREVSPLPFELACPPQRFYRLLRLPVVSYAIPALVAIGQARFFHRRPRNPLTRLIRRLAVGPSLRVLQRIQPDSGGFLEAVPLTSFVVMSLAGSGQVDHPVTRKGVEFLLSSVRADGTWPIDTNLATWNTTLSINALAAAGENVAELECLDWLLECQHRRVHPYSGAAPGGWAWTDLSGGVPDVDDTSGALLALAAWSRTVEDDVNQRDGAAGGSLRSTPGTHPLRQEGSAVDRRQVRERIRASAQSGVRWLLDLQNSDGGWPTFCRGWGTMPFDRSGADLTAHALRALGAWSAEFPRQHGRIGTATDRGFRFLRKAQRADGSWVPLWFGNQYNTGDEENPIYGTAKVLCCYRDFGLLGSEPARRGVAWLAGGQNVDGGWGGGEVWEAATAKTPRSSVEETSLAIEGLLAGGLDDSSQDALREGLTWLITASQQDRQRESSPIGFYFAKLWYYESLYPLIFATAALGRASRPTDRRSQSPAETAHLNQPPAPG